MKDKWMNIGYEGEELQPYHEPEADLNDDIRIRKHYTALNYYLYPYKLESMLHHMILYTCMHVGLQDTRTCTYVCVYCAVYKWAYGYW